MPLRLLTAGESHGPIQVAVVDGMISGLPIAGDDLDGYLARRQFGHGRGSRMRIEKDRARILSGVRNGRTTGAPITLLIENRDFASWAPAMSPEPLEEGDGARLAAVAAKAIKRLRPGHADFAGAVKYAHDDVRDVLERASARETVARVAAGALAAHLLGHVGVDLASHVVAIGGIRAAVPCSDLALPAGRQAAEPEALDRSLQADRLAGLRNRAEASPVRCADPEASAAMVALIDATGKAGDSLGGVVEVIVTGLPVGLGSYVQWDRRLDGRLAQAVMSIPAIKGVEIGLGFEAAGRPGSRVHDTFEPGFGRPTNHAGGLEGGVTNGQPLVLRAAMKPIATLRVPLPSATWPGGEAASAHFERADVCAVPAAGVIAEAMVAWVLADALLEKVGGDSFAEFKAHLAATLARQPEVRRGEAPAVAGLADPEETAE